MIGIGSGIYFGIIPKKNSTSLKADKISNSTNYNDFVRTGQNSFGAAICNDINSSDVAKIINTPILKTEEYSNSESAGCKYFVADAGGVGIDVAFGDMANQQNSLEDQNRVIKTDDRIKLKNILVYTNKGLIDIYLEIEPGVKYARIGRSSVLVTDDISLINLAITTEAKIRSYK